MGNPIRRIESPASTALWVIEAHRLFHLVAVIVHGKALLCRSNMPSYVILCLLCHNQPTICHTMPTKLLCLLCHNKRTVCHTMPTRGPCFAYNVILSCSTYCGTPCLLILYLFFITSLVYAIICLLRCHAIPTVTTVLQCLLCNNKPSLTTVR